jgi:hypothetical protein
LKFKKIIQATKQFFFYSECFRKEESTTENPSENFEKEKDFNYKYAVSPRTDREEKSPVPFNMTIFKVRLG